MDPFGELIMTKTNTKIEEVPLPVCRKCQRQAGLSGGICAYCLAKATGPSYPDFCPVWISPPSEEETVELDRAFTEYRRQAVHGGLVGKKADTRPCPNEAKLKGVKGA
jgi:hypothetical protein